MSFGALKRQSGNFADLQTKIADVSGKKSYGNEHEWTLTVDEKTGIGQATIRFLPAPEVDGSEAAPFVNVFGHSYFNFVGESKRWFIENCPTTLGKEHKCPQCEANSELWDIGTKEAKDTVSNRKRNKNFWANILVIDDPANPENNGKVFLYRFGPKIMGMITDCIEPQFADQSPFNPFDFWTGADFKLRAHKENGQRSYAKSEFAAPRQLSQSDEDMELIWKQEHSLKALIATDKFKSHAELTKRKNWVLNIRDFGDSAPAPVATASNNVPVSEPVEYQAPAVPAPVNSSNDDLSDFEALLNN